MRAEKAPMCSVRLLAIKLKGLAAPGEALKNIEGGNAIPSYCAGTGGWP